jgi:hypothetical protein
MKGGWSTAGWVTVDGMADGAALATFTRAERAMDEE